MSKFRCFLVLWLCINVIEISGLREEEKGRCVWDLARPFVKREERRTIFANENGQVTAARVSDRVNGSYLLHFVTLEPNSLFLPVLLHADMVFYVHTGAGRLGWNEDDDMRHAEVRKGDVYRLPAGTLFFAQSSLESESQKLRIYAIFANSINDLREPATGPYTSLSDLVVGFDKDVLQAAFQVPEDVIEDILSGAKQPPIIHGQHEMEHRVTMWDKEMKYVKQLVGNKGLILSEVNKKKDKDKKDEDVKMYNIMEEDKDFENCNGWSLTVTRDNLDALKGSDIGIFMVNLTKGSMMGPHWNRMATEIAIVLEGQGMVRVVCPKTNANLAECRNRRFHVHEGDVFVVPRFHPMTQIAFNNGSFVFMGFSTSAMYNNPQFLAGKASVFRALNVDVVAASFNVTNTTITQLFGAQEDLVILECVSCAGEELRIMEEEMEKEMDERRKKEEWAARKEEEERRQEEEEEKARREEEERKQREEEEAREEEEEKRREEEEEARKEEEEAREREEEEKARREEEERKQREEEEAREEEEERRREEEEERRREEEEEARKEEEEAREREEEEKARREEEERKQREEEEAWRKREKEERREEEEAHRGEGGRSREDEEERRQERARRAEEEARRAAKERDRRAQEEARRAAEEERERERRQWEPQEGKGDRGRPGRRQWEPQEGRGDRREPERRQWEPQEGRGSRGERKQGGRSSEEDTRRAAEEERERERRQWEPQEGRGGRGEQRRRQWEHQGGRGSRGEREEGWRGKWDDERRHRRFTI